MTVELDLTGVPTDLHARARTWFDRQMRHLERAHGPHWPANREWLIDYLNAELRELVAKAEGHHAV